MNAAQLIGMSGRNSAIVPDKPVTNHGWRFADAIDQAELGIPIGHYIIDGPNITAQGKKIIQVRDADIPNLGPNAFIHIKGDYYNYLDWRTTKINGGSWATPVTITNYGGQVRWGGKENSANSEHTFGAAGLKYVKFTGKYDPINHTGDPNFRGHDAGYAYSAGNYGFWGTMNWRNMEYYLLGIGGVTGFGMTNYFEMEYFEFSDGGFGLSIKWDSPTPPAQNEDMEFIFHDNYMHDLGGEGGYFGQNTNNGSHRIVNTKIYNNRFVRLANEAFQMGNFAEGCDVYNNVFIWAALAWKSPFQLSQDRLLQENTRNGVVKFRNNIAIGCSEYFIACANDEGINGGTDHPVAGNDIEITNNIFFYTRREGGYIFSVNDGVTGYKINDNWFCYFMWGELPANLSYTDVYPGTSFSGRVWTVDNSTTPIELRRNKYQAGLTFCNTRPNITLDSNVAIVNPQNPLFVNSGVADNFSYLNLSLWSARIGEKGGFPSNYPRKNAPNVYNFGDYCIHKSVFYRSNQNNNAGHEPQGITDAWWTPLFFRGGSTPRSPDDFRLTSQDQYNFLGIGLLDNLTPSVVAIPADTMRAKARVAMPEVFDPAEIQIAVYEKGKNKISFSIDYPTNILTNNTRIVAIGSSTLYGADAKDPGTKLHERLTAWVAANISGGSFYYMAKSGTYSDNFVPEESSTLSNWNRNIEAALALDPDIVLISLPSNDPAFNTNAAFISNLQLMFDKCKAVNVPCFITTTQPRNSYTIEQQQMLYDAASLIKTTFKEFAVDVFTPLANPYSPSAPATTKVEYASTDTIHANSAGHGVIFNTIIAAFQAYFVNKNYTKYQLYRSTSPTTGFTLLVDNITSNEIEINRTDGTLYYYRVRAQRVNSSFTAPSNVVSFQQPLFAGEVLETVQVDFSRTLNAGSNPGWNEWLVPSDLPVVGQTKTNLLNTQNQVTDIDLEITGSFNGTNSNGGRGGAIFPTNVIRSNWRVSEDTKSAIKISGLIPNTLYNIKVLASASSAGAPWFTGISIGDRRAYVAANDPVAGSNDGKTADILSVNSGGSGEIIVQFRALATATLGYANAMIIERCNQTNGIPALTSRCRARAFQGRVIGGSTTTGTVKINFTAGVDSGLDDWNDINVQPNVVFDDLITSDDNNSALGVVVRNVQTQFGDNGSSYGGSPMFPAPVLRYTRYRAGNPPMEIEFQNANPDYFYDIILMATRSNTNSINTFTINGVTLTLDVNNNKDQFVSFFNVKSDINGKILITVNSNTAYHYINAALITINSPQGAPVIGQTSRAKVRVRTPDVYQPEITGVTCRAKAKAYIGNVAESSSNFTLTKGHLYYSTEQAWVALPAGPGPFEAIICLAGSGPVASNSTIDSILNEGLMRKINQGDHLRDRYIVIAPWSRGLTNWDTPVGGQTRVKWAYDYLVNNYNIDLGGVYLTGLSLGGAGTVKSMIRYPSLFAGWIAVSGSQDIGSLVPAMKDAPGMSIHGTSDQTQAPQNTIRVGRELNAMSPKPAEPPIMTLLWGLGHSGSVWDNGCYSRKNSPLAGTKAWFDLTLFFAKCNKNPIKAAYGYVEWMEDQMNIWDYWKAVVKVNALSAGSDKTALLARLAAAKPVIYAKAWTIDLGSTNYPSASPINNITNINNGVAINNLTDSDGGASTIGFDIDSRFSTWLPQTDFTITMDGAYFSLPTTVSRDGARVLTSITGQFKFRGLNPAKKYKVVCLNCMDNGDDLATKADLRLTIGATTVTQYSQLNTYQAINVDNITPNGSNQIIGTVAAPSGRDSCVTCLILIEKS